MSKYKFSTKSKVIRVLMYVLISLFLSFVGVSVYLYFNPVEGDYKKAGYFKTSNDAYNTILAKGDLKSFDKGVLEVSYTTYISSFEKKENGVDLSSMMINTKDGIESLIISLPKNEAFEKSFGENEDALGYVAINLKFITVKDFKGLYTSYCNLLRLNNCSKNILLDSWEMKKVSENIDYSEVSKGVVRWLINGIKNNQGEYVLVSNYIYMEDESKFWAFSSPDEPFTKGRLVSKLLVGLSNSWKSIKTDEALLKDTLVYMKSMFEREMNGDSTEGVSCFDVETVKKNIEECGTACSSVLDSAFVNKYSELCKKDTTWVSLGQEFVSKISIKEDTFTKMGKSLSSTAITSYEIRGEDPNKYEPRLVSVSSDAVDYAYWLYNQSSVVNKSEALSNSYKYMLDAYAKYGKQYYGVCNVGKVALDYYFYSKEQKYLDDAVYILTNGSILGNNILFADSAVPYSSMVLGESVACMEFTNKFSKIVKEGSSTLSNMTDVLLRDRVLRSWDMVGYAGYVENKKKEFSKVDGGFYTYSYLNSYPQFLYPVLENVFILNLISSL